MSENYSGQIVIIDKTVGIFYNISMPVTRQRFTIAHELGHFILGHRIPLQGLRELVDIGSKDPIELEANSFAAELLMPLQILKSENSIDHKNLSPLAKKFNVSIEALRLRLLYDDYLDGVKFDYMDNRSKSETSESNDNIGSYSDLYPPSPDYEDDFETVYEFYSELSIEDLIGLKDWVDKCEDEDEYPNSYKAIKDLIKEYS